MLTTRRFSTDSHPLAVARHVLFDFDGPLCRFFASPDDPAKSLAPAMAGELRRQLRGREGLLASLPEADPHAVYRGAGFALLHDGDEEAVVTLRKRLDEFEVGAAVTAVPTPGAAELVRRLRATGRRLGIASNNCEAAIRAYLELAGLARWFDGPVIGRPDDPRRMKPDPEPVRDALRYWDLADAGAEDCVLIGDSVSDLEAAEAAGIAFCGYHRHEAKRRRLRAAADRRWPVVARLADLAAVLPPG